MTGIIDLSAVDFRNADTAPRPSAEDVKAARQQAAALYAVRAAEIRAELETRDIEAALAARQMEQLP